MRDVTRLVREGEGGVWERASVVEELMGEFMVTPSKVAAEPLCKTAEDLLPLLTAVEDDPEEDTDEEEEDHLENSMGVDEEEEKRIASAFTEVKQGSVYRDR